MKVIAIKARSVITGGGGLNLHYWSDNEYIDPLTGQEYMPVLTGSIIIERGNDTILNPVGISAIGNIQVDNTNGHLDEYLQDIWKNRLIEVFYGDTSQGVTQMLHIGDYRVAGHPEDSGVIVSLPLRDLIGDLASRPINDRQVPNDEISANQDEPLIIGRVGFITPLPTEEDETNTAEVRHKTVRYRYMHETARDNVSDPVKRILINGRQAYPTYHTWDSGGNTALSPLDLRAAIGLTNHTGNYHGELTLQQNIYEDVKADTNIGFYKCTTNDMTAIPTGDIQTPCTWGTSGAGVIVTAGHHWNGTATTIGDWRFVIYPTTWEALSSSTVITYDSTETATLTQDAIRDDSIIYNEELLSQDVRFHVWGLDSTRPWGTGTSGHYLFADVVYMLYSAYNDEYDDSYVTTSFEDDMLAALQTDIPYGAGVCLKNQETFVTAMMQLLDKGYCITSSKESDLFVYYLEHVSQMATADHTIELEEIVSISINEFIPSLWRVISRCRRNFDKITNSLNTTDSKKRGTTALEWARQAFDFQWLGEWTQTKDYAEQPQYLTRNGIAADDEDDADDVAETVGAPYATDSIVYRVTVNDIKDYELNEIVDITYDRYGLDGHKLRVLKIVQNFTTGYTELLLWGDPPTWA